MIIASGPFKGWELTWDDRGEYNPTTLAPPPGSSQPVIAEDLEAVLQRVFSTPDLPAVPPSLPAVEWVSPVKGTPQDGQAVCFAVGSHDGPALYVGHYEAARGLFHFGPVSGGYYYHLRSVIGWQPAPALPDPSAFPWGFMFPSPDFTGKYLNVTEAEAMAVQDAFTHGTPVQLRGRWFRCHSWGWAVGQAPGVPQYLHAGLRAAEAPAEGE